jgi:large subunit ribosomal protein L6
MSRIGKKEIIIPENVQFTLQESEIGTFVKVVGPKGELQRTLRSDIKVLVEDKIVRLSIAKQTKQAAALFGLYRTLINNMVIGVTIGFTKCLEIRGIGYKVLQQGDNLNFQLGKSHPEVFEPPQGLEIIVEGSDKELVGQVAAVIRSLRPVEVYKGKGVRYKGEVVRKKAGKSGGK